MEKILNDIKALKGLPPEEKVERARAIIHQCADLPALELDAVKKELKKVAKLPYKAFEDELRKVMQRNKKTAAVADDQGISILHGAIDFPYHSVVLGFRDRYVDEKREVRERYLCLFRNSTGWEIKQGSPILLEIHGKRYLVDPRACPPWLEDTWGREKLEAFLDSPIYPKGAELFHRVAEVLKRYLEFQTPGQYYLVAAWAIGTWVAHLFSAYPFLFFFGPKETGKSKVLEVLEHITFNGVKVKHVTAAALGDIVEEQRGTILVDQAENMPADLVALMADSYKKAGGRRRVTERSKTGQRMHLEFHTYGPKAFAGQKSIDTDLLDRCIKIPMLKTKGRYPDFIGSEPEWLELKDFLYRWMLQRHSDAVQAYKRLNPTGTRRGELWRPLESIVKALDLDGNTASKTKEAFDVCTEETKHQPDEDEETFFDYLISHAGNTKKRFVLELPAMTGFMLDKLDGIQTGRNPGIDRARLKTLERNRSRWIGEVIKKFSLGKQLSRKGRAKIRRYAFEP